MILRSWENPVSHFPHVQHHGGRVEADRRRVRPMKISSTFHCCHRPSPPPPVVFSPSSPSRSGLAVFGGIFVLIISHFFLFHAVMWEK